MADDIIALFKLNYLGTLGDTTLGFLDVISMQADCSATLVDNHQVIVILHDNDGNKIAGLLGNIKGLDTLGVTARLTILLNICPLAKAVLTKHHDALGRSIVDDTHSHNLIACIIIENDALHTSCGTSHRTNLFFIETNCAAKGIGNDDFVFAVGEFYADYLIVFANGDGIDAIGTNAAVLCQTRLLYDAPLSAEHYKMALAELRIIQLADAKAARPFPCLLPSGMSYTFSQ